METTGKKSVMIVEDDRPIARFIEVNLQMLGFQVTKVFNGQEALEALKNFTPDLIILDLAMPKMDGETFYTHLRSNPATYNIGVIILTAKPMRLLKNSPIIGEPVLEKPVDAKILKDLVSRTISSPEATFP